MPVHPTDIRRTHVDVIVDAVTASARAAGVTVLHAALGHRDAALDSVDWRGLGIQAPPEDVVRVVAPTGSEAALCAWARVRWIRWNGRPSAWTTVIDQITGRALVRDIEHVVVTPTGVARAAVVEAEIPLDGVDRFLRSAR